MRNTFLTTGSSNTCYGCRACEQACPKFAIRIEPNHEGFLYPIINESLCIDCGLCVKVCSYDSFNETFLPDKAFAIQYKKRDRLLESASGGAFPVLADYILKNGGYVSGCIFDEKFKAVHIVTSNYDDVKKMSGSKYVQSDLSDTYSKIKDLLLSDKLVLFSGTPCQVAGLLKYLRKPYSNLYTLDLICHGVPSPFLLKEYLNNTYEGNRIIDFKFRDKKNNGWCSQGTVTLQKKNGKFLKRKTTPFRDSYYNLYYLQNCVSRYSCYECKFSCSARVSDLTIGDFWNIREISSLFNYNNGVSAVLINTEKGLSLFNSVKELLIMSETTVSNVVAGNPNLRKPCEKPIARHDFYSDLEKYGYNGIVKKYCKFQYVLPVIRKLIPSVLKKKIRLLLSK